MSFYEVKTKYRKEDLSSLSASSIIAQRQIKEK